ncbi:hypothetical protein LCGC14_0696790 [marine sediment metagenome]|uniref:Ubiquitin-activating enzyme E1 FCCH domain-containing protein n=1 Tax=marine sediment metagenome TaxID=412755 RepID=A0A0F9TRQ9_9ZZZZ
MAEPRTISFPFPLLGLERRTNIRNAPPFSAVDALNVRPIEQAEGRQRGGTRPGFQKAFLEQLSTGPVQNLAQMNIASVSGSFTWVDTFDGSSMLSVWTAPTFLIVGDSAVLPAVASDASSGNFSTARTPILGTVGAIRDDFADLDTSAAYVVVMNVYTHELDQNFFYVFLKMDNTTPDALQDGLFIELKFISTAGPTFGSISGSVKSYVGGVLQNTYNFAGGNTVTNGGAIYKIVVSGSAIVITLNDIVLLDTTLSESQSGRTVGFGIRELSNFPANHDVPFTHIDTFSLRYQPTGQVDSVQRRQFSGIGGGDLYVEDDVGAMILHSSSVNMRADVTLQAIEHLSKLYIADYGDQRAGRTDGTISADGLTLDTSGAFTFNDKGIDLNVHVIEIFDVAGGAVAGIYEISTINAGDLILSTSAGTTGNCSFRIERGPKVYDPVADTLTAFIATQGIAPFGYAQVTRYLDRLCWAGHLRDGRNWEQSRQGAPDDYDFFPSSNSIGRAVSGQTSLAGVLAAPVTAQIPHTDDYMVYASLNSMWVLRGDATSGGLIDNLSRVIGIVSENAYAFGPEGELIFLSRDGLYILPFGGTNPPVSLSAEKLPRELKNIDTTLFKIGIEYDINDRGVHIFLTPLTSGNIKHFWFDWSLKGFWPVEMPSSALEPFVTTQFASDDVSSNAIVFGCRDGFIRRFLPGANQDDVFEITSRVVLGPLFLGGSAEDEGILLELEAALGQASANVSWELYVGDTPEQAVSSGLDASSTPFASGTFLPGLNRSERPKARGNSVLLVIQNIGSTGSWVFNEIFAKVKSLGRQRIA